MRDGAMAYAYSERGDLRAYVRVRGRAGVHTSGRVESIGRARPQKEKLGGSPAYRTTEYLACAHRGSCSSCDRRACGAGGLR